MAEACNESLVVKLDFTSCVRVVCGRYEVLHLEFASYLLEHLRDKLEATIEIWERLDAIRYYPVVKHDCRNL